MKEIIEIKEKNEQIGAEIDALKQEMQEILAKIEELNKLLNE